MKNILDEILDDNEKLAIQMFYDNELQREAVKKVLLAALYYNGVLLKGQKACPTMNFLLAIAGRRDISDEQMGREARTAAEGVAALENGFDNLASYMKEELLKPKKNPAR